jgi:hypothetical protein
VLRVERSLHPQWFGANNTQAYSDIEVSDLVREGVIAYDQTTVPDALAQKRAA